MKSGDLEGATRLIRSPLGEGRARQVAMKLQRATTTAVVPLAASSGQPAAAAAETHASASNDNNNNSAVQPPQPPPAQSAGSGQSETTTTTPTHRAHESGGGGGGGACLQDTRTHVVGELYDTERSYVESLQIIIEKYMKPLKNYESNKTLIEASLVDEIFLAIPEILAHHENFLSALQARLSSDWDSSQVIGNLFIEAFTNQQIIDTYTAFINNWKNARHAIKVAIQAKPAFERFLEAMSREHRNKLTLDALLIMPVQRIPRYELLIKELIKHTPLDHPDHGPLIEAQRQIHELALKIDRAEREMIHQEQLKELEALIEGHCELQQPQRDFLRYDLVTIAASSLLHAPAVAKKERVLFLFCDLLLIASVKKKVSRRSNLQAAFASSTNDLALLEGNKFKLILRLSLDQIELRQQQEASSHTTTTGGGGGSPLVSTSQWQRENGLQLASAADVRRRRQELEADVCRLAQVEALLGQMVHLADQARLSAHLAELAGQLRRDLRALPAEGALEGAAAALPPLAGQQQQQLPQHPVQLVKDLYLIQAPVSAQSLAGASASGAERDKSGTPANSGTPQHQPLVASASAGAGEQHALDGLTLELLISSSSNSNNQKPDSSLTAAHSSASMSCDMSRQDSSGGGGGVGGSELALQQHHQQHQHQQQLMNAANYETLVVTFSTRDRRQSFLQAFLEAKQARHLSQLNQLKQQRQRLFTSSLSATKAPGQPEHLIKSQSIASDMRRNRLRHQDEVLEMRLSDGSSGGGVGGVCGGSSSLLVGRSGGGTSGAQEDRNSSAPCVGTIVHQMSAPLSLACHADAPGHVHAHHVSSSPLGAGAPAADLKALHSAYCTPCSPNTCTLETAPGGLDQAAAAAAAASHQHHHHHHHHHQLMASNAAQLHTICCHERHNDLATPASRPLDALKSTDQLLQQLQSPTEAQWLEAPDCCANSPQQQQQQQQQRQQQDSASLALERAPKFLLQLPINFLNTQHPALQLTCAVARKWQTVAGDASNGLWVCMSNGYVSHIALLAFERKRLCEQLEQHAKSGAGLFTLMPAIQASGDICKAQINCAAQVANFRPRRPPSAPAAAPSEAEGGEQGREARALAESAPTVSIKAASPPVDIAAKCKRPAAAAASCSRSAPSPRGSDASAHGGVDVELEEFLRSAGELRRGQAQATRGRGGGEPRALMVRQSASCDTAEGAAAAVVRRAGQHRGATFSQRPAYHHHSHDQLMAAARCLRCLASRPGGGGCAPHAPLGNNAHARWLVSSQAHQHHFHHHHYHHHHHHHHLHHNLHHSHSHSHQHAGHQHHQHNLGHHHHHQAYHGKHHTMALGELRRAFERQQHRRPLELQQRPAQAFARRPQLQVTLQPEVAGLDQQQPQLIGAAGGAGANQLALPAARNRASDGGLHEPRAAPEARSGRTATLPPAQPLSPLLAHKSLRSARLLRHQASLKTSSILAKLVGTASRGSSYLSRKSGGGGKRRHRPDWAADKSDREDEEEEEDDDDEEDDEDTDGGGRPAAAGARALIKRDDSSSVGSNSLAVVSSGAPALPAAAGGGQKAPAGAVVSPLSSVSSLNSAASSLAVNSVCASSPNSSSCSMAATAAAAAAAAELSGSTCCAFSDLLRAPAGRLAYNSPAGAPRRACRGGGAGGQLRSRSATVPCRPFCELRAVATRGASVEADCELRACNYKVSELLADQTAGGALTSGREAPPAEAKEASERAEAPSNSLWLGCDDGSLIVIDCLSSNSKPLASDTAGRPACNVCDQTNELGCQNVHSEVKLGAPICDIRGQRDERVFVALANGQLAVFSRATSGDIPTRGEDNDDERRATGQADGGGAWALGEPQLVTLAPSEPATSARLCLVEAPDESCGREQGGQGGEEHSSSSDSATARLWFAYGRQMVVLRADGGPLELVASVAAPACVEALELAAPPQQAAVWAAFRASPLLRLYDGLSGGLLLEISLLDAVDRVLAGGNEILRHHKLACLGTTSLLATGENALLVGTSAGIVFYLTICRLAPSREGAECAAGAGGRDEEVPSAAGRAEQARLWRPQVVSLRHGHSGQVKFLHLLELEGEQEAGAQETAQALDGLEQTSGGRGQREVSCELDNSRELDSLNGLDTTTTTTRARGKTRCLVSGGAGLDLYGPGELAAAAAAGPRAAPAGDEDSLSHLILWRL